MTDSDTSSTGRKKPGAKRNPFIADQAAHRKEKNRQAQKALRERRSQQALETQTELRALRSQVASLGHDRSQLRHENRQMQNLLALTFSSWIPEVAKEMANGSSHDAVMIAAKALAELQAGGAARQPYEQQPHHHHHHDVYQTPYHHQSTPEASHSPIIHSPQLAVSSVLSISRGPATPTEHPSSPVFPASAAVEPSPFPSPPQASSCCPSSQRSLPLNGSDAPPAAVENCAEMMPCFVLKERILKYGRHIDLAALCNELVHRAVCHGNPWDPADWTVPPDLFERFPAMR
ncbi:hypothetical protein PhCBS80983_g01765 [Powellomyces hirtus]|uniref:BZIP domain-containing protein n=1 Tax=Powellomyces hirtus TaxID=109895 RepID=A0A507E9H6_9FUNG|nr:hypothetical protein PhCBS80983_g01765 [Powellomyces hirtus]